MKLEDKTLDCRLLREIQRDIDIVIASLLLTGQITVSRIYFGPGYFGFTVGGPITGGSRLEAKKGNQFADISLDVIDIILAILLITDEINLVGLFISSDARFSLSISGPIFGREKVVPVLPYLKKNQREFRNIVNTSFRLDTQLVDKLKKASEVF